MAARCSLGELPVELFLDGIFPLLPVTDLLHLGSTNRFFSNLANDEAYWHRRIQEDFNFSGSDTARKTGWKFLYKRLSHPQVYVWGCVPTVRLHAYVARLNVSQSEKSQSRLGLVDTPKTAVRDGVPYPVRLDIPGVRIVSLVAGGMCELNILLFSHSTYPSQCYRSFHAIDSRGDVYVWGKGDRSPLDESLTWTLFAIRCTQRRDVRTAERWICGTRSEGRHPDETQPADKIP